MSDLAICVVVAAFVLVVWLLRHSQEFRVKAPWFELYSKDNTPRNPDNPPSMPSSDAEKPL